MITFRRALGFLAFAVAVQFLFRVAGVDILEDLNILGELRCWPWLLGALVIYLLLEWLTHRYGTKRAKWVVGVGFLTALLVLGWFLPVSSTRDGLAVGINRFLNTYWILTVAVFWLGLHGVVAIMRGSKNRRTTPDSNIFSPREGPDTKP